jgi:hypothetical protein
LEAQTIVRMEGTPAVNRKRKEEEKQEGREEQHRISGSVLPAGENTRHSTPQVPKLWQQYRHRRSRSTRKKSSSSYSSSIIYISCILVE